MSESRSDAELTRLRQTAAAIGISDVDLRLPDPGWVRTRDGLTVAFRDWGGAGKPILFLHGYGLSARSWDAVCLAIRDEHRCIAVDQRGHGESDWSPSGDYYLDTRIADAEDVLGALALAPCVLVGQSLGGLVALGLAAKTPGTVRALVIVDATPFTTRRSSLAPEDDVSFMTVDEAFYFALRTQPRRDPLLLRANVARNLRRREDGRWTWRHDQSAAMRRPEDPVERNSRLAAVALAISCPTLVIRGSDSDVVTRVGAKRLVRAIPTARYVEIPRAGHNVHGDQPVMLAGVVAEFIAALNLA